MICLPKINRSTRRESRHVRSGGEVRSKGREHLGNISSQFHRVTVGESKTVITSRTTIVLTALHLDCRPETPTRVDIDTTILNDNQQSLGLVANKQIPYAFVP